MKTFSLVLVGILAQFSFAQETLPDPKKAAAPSGKTVLDSLRVANDVKAKADARIEAFGEIGTMPQPTTLAIKALEYWSLRDEDPEVRSAAERALDKLGTRLVVRIRQVNLAGETPEELLLIAVDNTEDPVFRAAALLELEKRKLQSPDEEVARHEMAMNPYFSAPLVAIARGSEDPGANPTDLLKQLEAGPKLEDKEKALRILMISRLENEDLLELRRSLNRLAKETTTEPETWRQRVSRAAKVVESDVQQRLRQLDLKLGNGQVEAVPPLR